MMTKEQNERLTRVSAGTSMGALLHRYWHPIATSVDLDQDPVRRVRLMGEDLTLYRSESGMLGLIGPRCAHRCVDLDYGISDEKGLRCPYHGWLHGKDGQCLEIPFDDRNQPEAPLREKIKIPDYPVEALGGLIFAYLGPAAETRGRAQAPGSGA